MVTSEEAERAAAFLAEIERESMTPEERAAQEAVIDLDAEENACPACLETIPKGVARCTSCGLRIG